MNRTHARETLAFVFLMSAVVLAFSHCAGCSPAEVAEAAAASSYEAQQMRCVEQYAKKADIDRCRIKVKAAWSTVDAGSDQ